MSFTSNVCNLVPQISAGIAFGFANFLFSTTVQKVLILAGVKFEEYLETKDVHSNSRFDLGLYSFVIKYPVIEELIHRGLLQPFFSEKISLFLPRLKALSATTGIPLANLVSSVVIGVIFSPVRYFNYKSGGIYAVLIASISSSFYGFLKERFSLISAIAAHSVHDFMKGLVDKKYLTFLEG